MPWLMPSRKAALLLGAAIWAYPGASVDLDFANNRAAVGGRAVPLSSLLSATGGTIGAQPATVQNADGSVSYSAAPRIGRGTGLLVEQQSTNLLKQSVNMGVSPWTGGSNATLTPNAGACPDGSNSACQVSPSAQYGGVAQTNFGTLTGSSAYTLSVWIKVLTGNTNLSLALSDGAGHTQVITATNQWARYSVTFTTTASPTTSGFQIQDNNPSGFGSFLVWGAQVELSPTATSLIPTTTAAATRTADVVQLAGPAIAAFQQGTLSVRSMTSQLAITSNAVIFANGTSNQSALRTNVSNAAQMGLTLAGGTALTAVATLGSGTVAGLARAVMTGSPSAISLVANGGTPATAASAWTVGTGPVYLGDAGSGNRTINGFLSRLTAWSSLLSTAQANLLSSQ